MVIKNNNYIQNFLFKIEYMYRGYPNSDIFWIASFDVQRVHFEGNCYGFESPSYVFELILYLF